MSINNQKTNQVVGLYPLPSQTQCDRPHIKQYLIGPNLNQLISNETFLFVCHTVSPWREATWLITEGGLSSEFTSRGLYVENVFQMTG